MRRLLTVVVTIALVAGLGAVRLAASMAPATAPAASVQPIGLQAVACDTPTVPSWFHRNLVKAVKVSGDLPPNWANKAYIAKIACWQGANFQPQFAAHDANHRWHGIFVMTSRELATIAGPAEVSNPKAFGLTAKCWIWGWAKCPHRVANSRVDPAADRGAPLDVAQLRPPQRGVGQHPKDGAFQLLPPARNRQQGHGEAIRPLPC